MPSSEQLGGLEDLPQQVLIAEVRPHILHPPKLLQLVDDFLHVVGGGAGGIGTERRQRVTVVGVQPVAEGSAVDVDHAAHVPPQQLQVLQTFIDVVGVEHQIIALLLRESVCDAVLRIEERHDQLAVASHSGGPEHRLAFLHYVLQEFLTILPAVDAEIGIVLGVLDVVVVLPKGCQQVALFIRRERIHEAFVHLEHHGELVAELRRQQFGFG